MTDEPTCARCLKPTDTGVALDAREGEWIIAATMRLLDKSLDEAVRMLAEAHPGFRPVGRVPVGRVDDVLLRLCAECGAAKGIQVSLIDDETPMRTLRQPEQSDPP